MASLRDVCVCVNVCVCVSLSLSPSLVSSAIASAVPNLSLRSQPVSQQLLNRSLHYCKTSWGSLSLLRKFVLGSFEISVQDPCRLTERS
jgi:hypothetical protein